MTDTTIFEKAYTYDFPALKDYILSGGEINITDKDGSSLFAEFILGYVRFGDCPEGEEKELVDTHENDDEFLQSYVYKYQKTPLHKRKSGIKQQLDFLFKHGADPNLYRPTSINSNTPLIYAVCDFDYFLSKYLLEHGADPGLPLFNDEYDIKDGKDYWLMDELDIAIMNGVRGELASHLLALAQLLWEYGLRDWNGYCITVDKEKGVMDGHSPRVKY